MAVVTIFRLLVIFFVISHLICFSNGIPITRIGRLMHGPQVLPVPENYPHMVTKENKSWEEQINEGRMMVELHDYPGFGANNRHNPRPPQLGRCVDC